MKARGGGRGGAGDGVSLEDTRRVPAREGRGEVREKASRFFGIAAPAATPRAAEEFLEGLRREHHDATHVAYAWKCGAPGSESLKSSDDGEPSGTAGRPIAAAISSAGLTDVVVNRRETERPINKRRPTRLMLAQDRWAKPPGVDGP